MKIRSAMLLSQVLLTSTVTLASAHMPELSPWMQAYSVYANGDVEYVCSDFEGTLAASGRMRFSRMGLATSVTTSLPAVAARTGFSLIDGSVGGIVETGGDAWLDHYSVDSVRAAGAAWCAEGAGFGCYSGIATSIPYQILRDDLASYGAKLATLPAVPGGRDASGVLLFAAVPGLNVFSIDAQELEAASRVEVSGPKEATVVVIVKGEAVSWSGIGDGVSLSGGVTATSVMWAFLEAGSLLLHHINIYGTVLAPIANVSFYEGRIEGNLFVGGNLVGNPMALSLTQRIHCAAGASGGQVNFVPFIPTRSASGVFPHQ